MLPLVLPVLSSNMFLLMLMVIPELAIGFMLNAEVRLEKCRALMGGNRSL